VRAKRGPVPGQPASLDELLASKGFTAGKEYEGYSQQIAGQVATLRRLVTERRPGRILEIGFNAGHSADVLLAAAPAAHLLSFDLGRHPAVAVGKGFIDARYPGRHTLVVGDSTASVPAFTALVPDVRFEVLFIDGGHTEEVARADIVNCGRLAAADAIVAVDDTVFTPAWEQSYTLGPTKAWLEAVQSGLVVELGREEYALGRGMVWGRYR
jgi:predicted O-methyltransferase YrrM